MKQLIIFIIIFILSFSHLAVAELCRDRLGITTQKSIYKPSEHVQIFLDVAAADVPASRVDAHVAWVQPSGNIEFIHRITNWQVADLKNELIGIKSLENKEIGQYQLYFILARTDSNPLNSNNWLAKKRITLSLLPESWKKSEQEIVFSNNGKLPQLIAHGGGEVAGQLVTNTLQALNKSYDQGHRFFELDFSWTADHHLVLMHDWQWTYQHLFSQYPEVPDLKTFNQLLMNFGLTQLSFEQLLEWLGEHPDAIVITDIKDRNIEGLTYIAKKVDKAQKQFIPQIYSISEYDQIMALGYHNTILTLYRSEISDSDLLSFVQYNSLAAVTLPVNRVISSLLAQNLKNLGVFVYAHTVNQTELFEYLTQKGISGIYSDKLVPAK